VVTLILRGVTGFGVLPAAMADASERGCGVDTLAEAPRAASKRPISLLTAEPDGVPPALLVPLLLPLPTLPAGVCAVAVRGGLLSKSDADSGSVCSSCGVDSPLAAVLLLICCVCMGGDDDRVSKCVRGDEAAMACGSGCLLPPFVAILAAEATGEPPPTAPATGATNGSPSPSTPFRSCVVAGCGLLVAMPVSKGRLEIGTAVSWSGDGRTRSGPERARCDGSSALPSSSPSLAHTPPLSSPSLPLLRRSCPLPLPLLFSDPDASMQRQRNGDATRIEIHGKRIRRTYVCVVCLFLPVAAVSLSSCRLLLGRVSDRTASASE
jgi:hypothetical protein